MTPVELGTGCAVVEVAHAVEGAGDRVSAHTRLDVVSEGGCARLSFPLPAGAGLGDWKVVERRHDGTRVRLDDTRWEVSLRDPDGDAIATLHVPDLWKLDQVRVTLERTAVPVDVASAWRDGTVPPAAPGLLPAVITHRSRVLTLALPPGNPQLTLHPEGEATSHVDEEVVVGAAEQERGFVVEAPDGVTPVLRAEPSGAATLVPAGTVWQVRVAPSEADARLVLSWDDEASPTHGERGALDELTVRLDDGRVRWEGDRWSIEQARDEWILPTRDVLISALDRRFKIAALPEPSIPSELRGAPASDETLADLRPRLAARAATLPDTGADPLFVRPLNRARKSGALTPTETALIQWLYARQLRFDAHWALVRPASTETLAPGAPDPVSPAGYTAPLLVVVTPEGDRWLDPTCGSCGTFELPPDLQGARVLSPSGRTTTPEPTPGAVRVEVTTDAVVYTAEGPPALLVRRALADATDRRATLAALVGGVGAELREVSGLDTGGAALRVVTTRGGGLVPDPTALPVPGSDGAWWFDWVGSRVFVSPGEALPWQAAAEGLRAEVLAADGVVERHLEVTTRRVHAEPSAFTPPEVSRPPPDPDPTSPTSEPSSP